MIGEEVFPPRREISDAELNAAIGAPAVYTNRIYLAGMSGIGFRISFAEAQQGGQMPLPRAAVFMSVADAIALRDLLNDQLKNAAPINMLGDKNAPEKPE